MDENKNFVEPRAGIIPYIWDNKKEEYVFMFMMPSNPKFGGSFIQIAKGKIDRGENSFQAAIREGTEELGLIHSNMIEKPFEISKTLQKTAQNQYYLQVYAVEIKNKKDFKKPHFETKFTTWTTNERFQNIGRKSQKMIVNDLNKILRFDLKNTF